MSFRIRGLDPQPFLPLYGLDEVALAARGVRRVRVDASPGVPDRIELRDLAPGETALLLNHVHQPADTPFRSSHAIYVREGATAAFDAVDAVPAVLRIRLLSVRAFDEAGMMTDADVVEGRELAPRIARCFASPEAAYLHVHYARPGCFAARVDRA